MYGRFLMKIFFLFVSPLAFLTLLASPFQYNANQLYVDGPRPQLCFLRTSTDLPMSEPCAFLQAQNEMSEQFKAFEIDIRKADPVSARYVKPKKSNLYGWTDNKRVYVVVTGNKDEDYDSLKHQYMHWINNQMKATSMVHWQMNLWIDMAQHEKTPYRKDDDE